MKIFIFSVVIYFLTQVGLVEASVTDVSNNELELYKKLYENQKESNGKILSTVYFALGFAATFIVLFLAANFWTTKNSRAKEFEALEAGNKSELLKMKNDFLKELEKEIESQKQLQSVEMENLFNKFSRNIESELRKIKDMNQENKGMLQELAANFACEQGDMRFENKRYPLALGYYIDYWEKSDDIFIDNCLDKIFECLEKMDWIFTDDITKIIDLLHGLPHKYNILVSKIESRIRELPTH